MAAMLGAIGSAQADTITFTAGKAVTTTSWHDTVHLGMFDSTLGTLTSINFQLDGTVNGFGRAESLDTGSSDVTLALGSVLTLHRPDGSTLVVTNPVFSHLFALSGFDGTIDFAGGSGGSTGVVVGNGTNSFSSVSGADFALFSAAGGGSIALNLDAIGSSNASGAGNLITQFSTAASGLASITYNYTTLPVPEPETYAMLLGGLGLLALARRRSGKACA